MEITKQHGNFDSVRSLFGIKSIAKEMIIAVVIGLSYFTMLVANPLGYLTGLASFHSLANIRWANMLKASALFSPSAIIGMACASYSFNVYTGKIAIGAYSVSPLLHAGAAFIIYFAARAFGRSFKKDIIYMTLLGAMAGVIISSNLALIALFTTSAGFTHLISILVTWKVATHIMIYVGGYLVMIGAQTGYNKFVASRK